MSLVLVQLLFFSRGAARADSSVLYVSTAGSDQNPCTVALPCASLDRATTLAQPLDTVEVASGVYGPQHIYAAGASDNPITITADRPVTITVKPQPYCLLCIWDHSHDVTVHGFTVLGHPVDPTIYGTPQFPPGQPGGHHGEVATSSHHH
jgi:hypothetical protein